MKSSRWEQNLVHLRPPARLGKDTQMEVYAVYAPWRLISWAWSQVYNQPGPPPLS